MKNGRYFNFRDICDRNLWDTGYLVKKLQGYGILRPPLMGPQVCTTEFNALRFQRSCQIQLKIAITGLSFSTRGIRKSFSLHLGCLGYHITKAERDGKASFSPAFPLSGSEMHLLQDVCSAGWRISLVELKRKKKTKNASSCYCISGLL